MDMRAAIQAKSDQMNAEDLIGRPRTIKITKVAVKKTPVQPVTINFEGDEGKPYKPCKGMCKILVEAWGDDSSKYVGRSLTVFRDPSVLYGGVEVGGIVISHLSDIPKAFDISIKASKTKSRVYHIDVLAIKTIEQRRLDCVAALNANGVKDFDENKIMSAPDEATLSKLYKEFTCPKN
jgi:hypothetical protein